MEQTRGKIMPEQRLHLFVVNNSHQALDIPVKSKINNNLQLNDSKQFALLTDTTEIHVDL